jgi:peptidoglycan/xylan/chitin deacetylase (PgdA/CDA1 family)
MTSYVFAYDLEDPDLCLRAAPRLVELHRRYETPATFFVLGTVLERRGPELRALFGDDPLFDIASHTYSHKPLKDNRVHGPGIDLEDLGHEIERGLQLVEEVFEKPCVGVRSGYGFYGGLRGEAERLRVIRDSGARYLSSDLRGPGDSVPGGLAQAYRYDEEGVPELLELPGHGWHDNVLKGFYPGPWLAWPPMLRWGIPDRVPRTPEEEFAVQRVWIERALALELDYFSPLYHPHSIYLMSPDCRVVEFLMRFVRQRVGVVTTYGALYEAYSASPKTVPGRDAWTWEEES